MKLETRGCFRYCSTPDLYFPSSQVCDDLLVGRRQVHRLPKRLRPIHARVPVHFYLVAVRVLKIDADGVAVADRTDDGYVVLQEEPVKLFDIGETGATKGNLLDDFAVLPARHQQQLVVFFQPALGRHEGAARLGILVANLQAKNIPIKCLRTLDVAHVKTHMIQ